MVMRPRGIQTPMTSVFPFRVACAARLGWYPRRSAAAMTFWRVVSGRRTVGFRLRTWDAVWMLTPASAATSASVILFDDITIKEAKER